MAELSSLKKSKKNKRKMIDDEQESKQAKSSPVASPKPKKKKKDENDQPDDLNSTKQTAVHKQNGLDKTSSGTTAKQSVKLIRKRMLQDCEYFASLSQLANIPKHLTVEPSLSDEDSEAEMDSHEEPSNNKEHFHKVDGANRATTHEELKARLHQKIAEIKAKHHLSTNTTRAARKEKVKLKRLQDAAAGKSKKGLKDGPEKSSKDNKTKAAAYTSGNKTKGEGFANGHGKGAGARPHVKTDSGKVVFSKFDFATPDMLPTDAAPGKKKHMDPAAALAKIEKRKEKIKMWEEKGRHEKVKRIQDNVAWETALDKAAGTKVKDDETLLKKSLKRKQQQKASSKKKWEERVSNVEDRKQRAQQKRKDNLHKRKVSKKEGKMKAAVKKGRRIPGV